MTKVTNIKCGCSMYLLATGSVIMACNTELEIAVSHWPFSNQFLLFGRAIQFAMSYLLYTSNGEAIDSL